MKLRNPFKKKKKNAVPESGVGASGGALGMGNAFAAAALGGQPKKKKKGLGGLLGSIGKKSDKPKAGKKRMKDRHVTGKKSLGGGSANDVQKVSYNREIGDSGQTEGFFKSDFDRAKVAAELQQAPEDTNMAGTGYLVGIDEEDPRNAARAVASSRVDQLLGTNVLSQDAFAKHDGDIGVVSPQAKGKSIRENIYEEEASATSILDAKRRNNTAGGMFSIEDDGAHKLKAQQFNELDWADPRIQQGMANLDAIDYLTGQLDRHGNNIMVDPESGQVTGIDNDIAFGSSYGEGFEAKGLDKNNGLPELIDGGLAERMVLMDASQYEATLRGEKGDYGHLDEDEIAAAMKRFYTLQAYCEELLADPLNPDPRLIYNWDEDSLKQTLELGEKGGYLGKHKRDYDAAGYTSEDAAVKGPRLPGQKVA